MNEASVVICAYTLDRWEELKAAVASVRNQSHPPREIFVVVDGNEDLRVRAAQEFEGVEVVPNTKAPGLCGGRMTGAELATAPVVAFLDDDAVADSCWLAELLAAYDDPHVLGAGGPVIPLWVKPPPSWFPPEFNWVVGCTHDWMHVRDGKVRNPIGANMSVRVDVLQRAGGFAPELGRLETRSGVSGTADETELCIRTRRMYPGHYWAFRPRARVQHVVAPQRTTWRYFVRRCFLEGSAKGVLMTLSSGKGEGLSSERRYLLSVLPRAFLRALGAALKGEPGAVSRAGAMAAGVAITGYAYVKTRLGRRAAEARRAEQELCRPQIRRP